jgi:hypothetical protein
MTTIIGKMRLTRRLINKGQERPRKTGTMARDDLRGFL